ncbi:hypothetical protein LC55x_1910 [Lysobacter capsici]|nr:hypothetical protein LC55x_1910 [Lysobacter capsici]
MLTARLLKAAPVDGGAADRRRPVASKFVSKSYHPTASTHPSRFKHNPI